MTDPLLLYSTNTRLANDICRIYYHDLHYVHVSADIGSPALTAVMRLSPPSSSPHHRYRQLREEVQGNDLHGALIQKNRSGVLYGAEQKLSQGKITKQQRDEIVEIVRFAPINFYSPLLYVMPYSGVKHLLTQTPVSERASPTSWEAIIKELPSRLFGVVSDL